MGTLISHSPAETEMFGQRLAEEAGWGLVIGLVGDLGAGKTEVVKGLARGLGVTERVHSPTFALVHVYASGRMPLFHLDLYRLETTEEIIAAGLESYLSPEGIAVVEWMDRWAGRRPEKYREVRLEVSGEFERRITYDDLGI